MGLQCDQAYQLAVLVGSCYMMRCDQQVIRQGA